MADFQIDPSELINVSSLEEDKKKEVVEDQIVIPRNTLAYRNNNPGNLRFVGQRGASPGEKGFARFDSPTEGFLALIDQVNLDKSRGHTLSSFMNKYAPPSENNTTAYINQMSKWLGIKPDDPIAKADSLELAKRLSQYESNTKVGADISNIMEQAKKYLPRVSPPRPVQQPMEQQSPQVRIPSGYLDVSQMGPEELIPISQMPEKMTWGEALSEAKNAAEASGAQAIAKWLSLAAPGMPEAPQPEVSRKEIYEGVKQGAEEQFGVRPPSDKSASLLQQILIGAGGSLPGIAEAIGLGAVTGMMAPGLLAGPGSSAAMEGAKALATRSGGLLPEVASLLTKNPTLLKFLSPAMRDAAVFGAMGATEMEDPLKHGLMGAGAGAGLGAATNWRRLFSVPIASAIGAAQTWLSSDNPTTEQMVASGVLMGAFSALGHRDGRAKRQALLEQGYSPIEAENIIIGTDAGRAAMERRSAEIAAQALKTGEIPQDIMKWRDEVASQMKEELEKSEIQRAEERARAERGRAGATVETEMPLPPVETERFYPAPPTRAPEEPGFLEQEKQRMMREAGLLPRSGGMVEDLGIVEPQGPRPIGRTETGPPTGVPSLVMTEPSEVTRNRRLDELKRAMVAGRSGGTVEDIVKPFIPDEQLRSEALARRETAPERIEELNAAQRERILRRSEALDRKQKAVSLFKSEKGAIDLPTSSDAAYRAAEANDPAYDKLRASIGEPEKKPSIFSREGAARALQAFTVKALDRFQPLQKYFPETYDRALKHASSKDVAALEFRELENSDAMRYVRQDFTAFQDLVTAERDIVRAQQKRVGIRSRAPEGATLLPTERPEGKQNLYVWDLENPGGVTLEEAQRAKQAVYRKYRSIGKDPAMLQQAVDEFSAWSQKYILGRLRESGIISQSQYENILKENPFYAAYKVLQYIPPDMDNLPTGLKSKEYFSVANQHVLKAMKGTTKQIADPVEATLEKFMDVVGLAERNKVASTFIDEASTQNLLRPVAESVKEFKRLEREGKNPVYANQIDPKVHGKVSRFKDGKVETYITDKVFADSLKQITPAQAGKIIPAMNRVFRFAATSASIPFVLGNAPRDYLMAFNTSPVYRPMDFFKQLPLDWAKGVVEGIKYEFGGKSDVVEKYLREGGGFGWTSELRNPKVAKEKLFQKSLADKTLLEHGATIIKSPKHIFDLINKVSGAIELAPRLAVMEAAMRQGKTASEGASLSRRATIDFNRAGTTIRVLNQWVPFLNARVQGKLNVMEALAGPDKYNTLAKITTSLIVPSLATYALNQAYFPEEMKQIPDYVKKNYFYIIDGVTTDEKGKTVPSYSVIAKGDIGQMVTNPIEFVFDQWTNKRPQEFTKFLTDAFLSDISPIDMAKDGEFSLAKTIGSFSPPIAKGVAENIMNRNLFTDAPIESMGMQRKAPELRYKETTPAIYKWIAEKLRPVQYASPIKELASSPVKVQNLASSLFAGYGREGFSPEETFKSIAGRLHKTKGGAMEQKATELLATRLSEFEDMKSRAVALAEQGRKPEAMKMLTDWNKTVVPQTLQGLREYGFPDKGKARQSLTASIEEIRNVLNSPVKKAKKAGKSWLDLQTERTRSR